MTDLTQSLVIAMQNGTLKLQQQFIGLMVAEIKSQAETIDRQRGEIECLRLDLAEERAGKGGET